MSGESADEEDWEVGGRNFGQAEQFGATASREGNKISFIQFIFSQSYIFGHIDRFQFLKIVITVR